MFPIGNNMAMQRVSRHFGFVHGLCTESTTAMYKQYKGLVVIVQTPCTNSTRYLYRNVQIYNCQ